MRRLLPLTVMSVDHQRMEHEYLVASADSLLSSANSRDSFTKNLILVRHRRAKLD